VRGLVEKRPMRERAAQEARVPKREAKPRLKVVQGPPSRADARDQV
jgi:hypothetical protein